MSNPNFDEHRWIIHIRRTLDDELENDFDIPVSIFNVPKSLMICSPDCYVPQLVAIGPIHCLRPELHEMERFKLLAAKRTQKHIPGLKFQFIVDHLTKLEPKIRASYHKFLNLNHETLAWMMAIDASFLLEFLHMYIDKKSDPEMTRMSSGMSHLLDSTGRKSAHNMILKDIVMLENQIPLFVLTKVLEIQLSSTGLAENLLYSMFAGFCAEVSPFKIKQEFSSIQISQTSHLLHYIYETTVPKAEVVKPETTEADAPKDVTQEQRNSCSISGCIRDLFGGIQNLMQKLNRGPGSLIKRLIFSKPVKLLLKLPLTILSNFPGFLILKIPIEYSFSVHEEESKPKMEDMERANKPPLVEEITIPLVAELVKSGVSFVPTDGNISSISFDAKRVTLHLPIINLDVNTEVLIRNLVAYEASSTSGPLIFTRYTELMNGIIDTEEDVKLLRRNGIVVNRLKNDKEAANLWNGMSKSIRLTRVDRLDKVIEDVNKFYNGRWKIRTGKFLELYVFSSWRFLILMAAISLLMLMTLQTFCTIFDCA